VQNKYGGPRKSRHISIIYWNSSREKHKACTVQTMAHACGGRSIIENVAQVAAASPAMTFRAL
jgi:hypothetical protein